MALQQRIYPLMLERTTLSYKKKWFFETEMGIEKYSKSIVKLKNMEIQLGFEFSLIKEDFMK